MIDKLRSHLEKRKAEKGFTLIELLVVIAIIAILVVIVVVAINPVERLNDAADREAQSNVRSTGTLIGTCITNQLAAGGDLNDCETIPLVEANGDGNVPAAVAILTDVPAGTPTVICAWQEGRTGNFYLYSSATGQLGDPPLGATPVAANCV